MQNKKELSFKLFNPDYQNLSEQDREDLKNKAPTDAYVKISIHNINADGFERNTWVKIEANDEKVYRIVRGAVASGLSNDRIWMTYDTKHKLGIINKNDVPIKVSKANFYERTFIGSWNTPDLVQRNIFRAVLMIGLSSLVVGVINLFINIA